MVEYFDFIQLWYTLLTFSFAFGSFESLPQDFLVSFKMVQNLQILDLAMAKFK